MLRAVGPILNTLTFDPTVVSVLCNLHFNVPTLRKQFGIYGHPQAKMIKGIHVNICKIY